MRDSTSLAVAFAQAVDGPNSINGQCSSQLVGTTVGATTPILNTGTGGIHSLIAVDQAEDYATLTTGDTFGTVQAPTDPSLNVVIGETFLVGHTENAAYLEQIVYDDGRMVAGVWRSDDGAYWYYIDIDVNGNEIEHWGFGASGQMIVAYWYSQAGNTVVTSHQGATAESLEPTANTISRFTGSEQVNYLALSDEGGTDPGSDPGSEPTDPGGDPTDQGYPDYPGGF